MVVVSSTVVNFVLVVVGTSTAVGATVVAAAKVATSGMDVVGTSITVVATVVVVAKTPATSVAAQARGVQSSAAARISVCTTLVHPLICPAMIVLNGFEALRLITLTHHYDSSLNGLKVL